MAVSIRGPGRLHNVEWAEITDSTGTVRRVYELRNFLTKKDLGIHRQVLVVPRHSALDHIAFDVLGDARLWWVIADLNRDVIEDTLRVPAGTHLVVPTERWLTFGAR